jgi:hypothetical protein
MKYDLVKRYSGTPTLTKAEIAYPVETVNNAPAVEHRDETIFDYILQSREYYFQPPNRSKPTHAQPGSREKVRVMTERYRSGQPLHHPSDTACIDRRSGSRIYYNKIDQETKI